MKKISVFVITLLILSSCSQRLVDYTIISTKNVDLSKMGTYTRGKQRTSGKDVVHVVIYIPIGVPNMKEAIDRALEKVPGAVALVDGVVYLKSWWAVLYGQQMYVVEGTPLIDPSLTDIEQEIPDYLKIEMDRKGNIKEFRYISENEYLAQKARLIKNSNQ